MLLASQVDRLRILPKLSPTGQLVRRRITRLQRRFSGSSSPQNYHPKVRAFPFVVPVEDVLGRLRLYTALYSWYYGKPAGQRPGFLRYITEFDYTEARSDPKAHPKRIQALYLPVWLVDASIIIDGEIHHSSVVPPYPAQICITSTQSYMPGFVYEPLSRIALKSDALTPGTAVPFSEGLRMQHGRQITCLPFTHTPFSLLSLYRQLTRKKQRPVPTFMTKGSTAKANMMAAYPILVPVYVVNYECKVNGQPITYTAILEAAQHNGSCIFDDYFRLLAEGTPSTRTTNGSLLASLSPVSRAIRNMQTFANVSCSVLNRGKSSANHARAADHLSKEINRLAFTEGALEGYRSTCFASSPDCSDVVDWDDLRIREYTREEVATNETWAKLDDVRQWSRDAAIRVASSSMPLPTLLLSACEILDEVIENQRPAWLKEWHARPNKKDDGFA